MGSFRTLLLTIVLALVSLFPVEAQRHWQAVHVVQPGETLGHIAQRYAVDIYQLASVNGISR